MLRTDPLGYRARGYDGSPFVSSPGLPPHDGVYRASFYEAGLFVRLDLTHPAVPAGLAIALRDHHGDLVGLDGGLFEYERGSRSQHHNRAVALERLARRVDALSSPEDDASNRA